MPESEKRGRARERMMAFMRRRNVRLRSTLEAAPEELVGPSGPTLGTGFPPEFRRNLMRRFRERAAGQAFPSATLFSTPVPASFAKPAMPALPPSNNWIPLGPSVLRKGQAENRPAVSGRVPGIAVAPGGRRVYVASANGGIWRSDDGGLHWQSTMEALNLQPTTYLSDSLACGAVAIDPQDPDRVFVGTGEGDSVYLNNGQLEGTSAFFGVGPIRSDDAGKSWHTEPVKDGSPPLAGNAFYRLAIDPADRERVVAATAAGIYLREPDGSGEFYWVQKMTGVITSVVAAYVGGATTFYAAKFGGGVWQSSDGNKWTMAGAGLPGGNIGRVGLAVHSAAAQVLYALAADSDLGHLAGLWRCDSTVGSWIAVSGVPSKVFGSDLNQPGQGLYDLAIAVDPRDPNLVYLGGSAWDSGNQWSASLFRLRVSPSGTSWAAVPTYIGADVHADVHTLEFTPGSPDELWVGCDGGVFKCANAPAGKEFTPLNSGLATITMNHMAMHPSEDAVLFSGTQDTGTVRYTGDEAWLHSGPGDGGFVVIHQKDPYTILRTYTYGDVFRATDGGNDYDSWQETPVPLYVKQSPTDRDSEACEFYAPLMGAPLGDGNLDGNLVTFGSVRPWISVDFGTSWQSIPDNDLDRDTLDGWTILSMAFPSPSKLFAGTFHGGVYRFDLSAGQWTRTPLAPLPLSGPVTSIGVDPGDASGNSIYVTLGGHGDARHVWRFDGATGMWNPRSGDPLHPNTCLLDVHTSALLADPANPSTLYAGADIGIWKSTNAGGAWTTFAEGLPEAAVLDLKLHPKRRLLWATTYGRGIYERTADSNTALPVELYIRDTTLDRGRYPSVDGLPDPTQRGAFVSVHNGPGIVTDSPDASGQYQTGSTQIDFFTYVDQLEDRPLSSSVVNRIYTQVHNRGVTPAANTTVTLLLAPLSSGAAPALPSGFDSAISAGQPVAGWSTIGSRAIAEIRVGSPEVVKFDVPGSLVPLARPNAPAYCLLVVVNCAADPFRHAPGTADSVAVADRKVAIKYA